MVLYINEVLFNEPQGRPFALVQFGVSIIFLCIFVYTWSVGDAGEFVWILFLIVGTALSGIAESLPENRRQAAGVLRLVGILVLLILVTAPFTGLKMFIGG